VIVLGIWDGHDSGAALIADDTIVAAVNEERLSRRKLEVRFPAESIAACLRIAAIPAKAVDIVAASTSDVAKAVGRVFPSTKESYYQIRRRKAQPGSLSTIRKRAKYWLTELGPNPVSTGVSRACLRRELQRVGLGRAELRLYDHHHCHAVAAACASGFDRALVLTIDGVGDGTSATVCVLDKGRLDVIARTPAQHSPGIFFEHVTNLLNMRELEDEGKVMALAQYAPRPETNPLAGLLRADGLRFHTAVAGHALHLPLKKIQWTYPNEQFARMAQDTLAQATIDVVVNALAATAVRKVALSGGVASNIQINRQIRCLSDVDEVFVFPHMGDGGLALGAALAAASEAGGVREVDLQGLALGPSFSKEDMRRALLVSGSSFHEPQAISDAVVDLLCEKRIVMWFEGRMEYGPRALGHRSILARADDPSVRDRLNLVLKRRVWYQPFCPSILESDAAALFSDWKGRPDRFMTMAYTVRRDCSRALSAVVGVDGTCRPQVVPDDATTIWAELLRGMKRRLGAGVVLNTSFNIHGEPLVCTPAEAIDVFRRSGADALALGPYLVQDIR
jgi:carbamoyltransferase